MKIKTLEEFHEQSPKNATHVLTNGGKYEYANFKHGCYNSCDNATRDEMLMNPMAGYEDWFFVVDSNSWKIHLDLRG